MNNPCIDCPSKEEDTYGLLCDLSCGKHTAYVNYQAGMKEVVEWVEANSQEAICMGATFRFMWRAKLKEWAE